MTYWQKRQQKLIQAMEKDEGALKKRLSSFYDNEYRKLDKEIAAYYKQYGTDNVIEYRKLMEKLSDEDRRLLFQRMEDFANKYPQYAHLIPVRESVYKLNRLEGLQYSVRMQQLEIGAVNNEQITTYLDKQAMRGLNATAEVMGFGKNYYANNPDITKLFVNVAWAGEKSFSERIWDNTAKLTDYLNTDIAQGIARGDSYEKLTRQLRERFINVSRKDAYRLIYTEGTFVMAESTMQPFIEDFQQYRISPVGDGKVCDKCTGISEQTFDIADRQAGVNFPPFHPWCRCTFEIVVDDWDKWMEDYERKHENGKAEEIAENLRADFKPEFVRSSTYQKMDVSQKQYIISELKLMPPSHRTLARPAINDIIFINHKSSYYDRKDGIIYLLENPVEGELTHEIAHALETQLNIYKDKEFVKIIKQISENASILDIFEMEYTKPDGNVDRYHVLDSEKFISEYQGRIYDYDNAFTSGSLDYKKLGEYFSEGYREFIINPNNLKDRDSELYNFIKRRFGV